MGSDTGTAESIGRSVDKLIGLCVSGIVTLALAAVTLKAVSYHNEMYPEWYQTNNNKEEQDNEEENKENNEGRGGEKRRKKHTRKKTAKVVGEKFIVMDDLGNVVFGSSPPSPSLPSSCSRSVRRSNLFPPSSAASLSWISNALKSALTHVLLAAVTQGSKHTGEGRGKGKRGGRGGGDEYYNKAYNNIREEDE
ncbi:hypothetical protein TrRE_jg822, partial [Triparma retinervis]